MSDLKVRPPGSPTDSKDAPPGLLQRGIVDHEAILHVALQQAVIRFVDLLDTDFFDVRRDAVLAAEIQHLLGFADAANRRSRKISPADDDAERADGKRLF